LIPFFRYLKSLIPMTLPVNQLTLDQFPHHSGKVREIYELSPTQLAMVHTNRLSAHDQNVCDVPNKGEILTKLSEYWFGLTQDICPNHFLYAKDNLMVVKKCQPIMIEVVIRAYITGTTRTSLWTHYQKGVRNYCGIEFPDGLVKNQKLPMPVITPTTKSEHDEPISTQDIIDRQLCTEAEWDYISEKALNLFNYASMEAEKTGFILVDTKLEFGRDSAGQIILIDEIFTCDSSRFWRMSSYQERFQAGLDPEGLDKDHVRRYINSLNASNDSSPSSPLVSPTIPAELIEQTRQTYIEFYQTLTHSQTQTLTQSQLFQTQTQTQTQPELELIKEYLMSYQSPAVMIISGSPSDKEHVNKIQSELNKQGLNNFWIACSAHKETAKVLALLNEINRQIREANRKIVIVAVAGLSNALGAVASCNSQAPVISCPPLTDQSYLIDVHSSLRNPSNVPVGYIGRPDNLAIHIRKWFNLFNF